MNVKQAKAIYLGDSEIQRVYAGDNLVYIKRPELTIVNAYIGGTSKKLVKETAGNNKTAIFAGEANTTYTISKVASNRFRVGCNASIIEAGTLYNTVINDSATQITVSTGNYPYIYIYYWTNTDTDTEETIKNSIRIIKN